MPIEFACDCGKQFRVSEEYAGKRSKCPACGIALAVPAAPESLSEEEAAYRALSEGPEPEPASRTWDKPGHAPATIPAPQPKPPPKAPTPPAPKRRTQKAATSDPYASREQTWTVDWGRVGGGIAGVLLGCVLLFGGLAMGRFFIWSPIIIIAGIFGIINGLFHKE